MSIHVVGGVFAFRNVEEALRLVVPPQPNEADEDTVERIIDALEPPDTMVTRDGSRIDLRAPWVLPK